MRNKKVLNIWLLSFGLLALFTFILPISKFKFVGEESGFVKVMFYLLNSVLILSLVALVVFAIINLFQDNYKFVKVMEIMALLGLIMVFMIILIFACSSYAQISIGYLLVALEMFACANFSQIARLINSSKELKTNFAPKKCCNKTNANKNNNQQNAEAKPEHENAGTGETLNN